MLLTECAVCGVRSSSFLEYRGVDQKRDIEAVLFAEKKTYRCRKCYHVFCHPRVDGKLLQKYYETQYDSSNLKLMHILRRCVLTIKGKITPSFGFREISQFKCVNRFLGWQNQGEVWTLEVGAAQAAFSRYLTEYYRRIGDSQLKVHTHAVEPRNQWNFEYRMHGIKKVADVFENVDNSTRYDMIHFSHSLEHFIDLHSIVKGLKEILSEKGILFVEVPNCEDLYWKYRFFPNPLHLHFFCAESLKRLFEAHGFCILFLKTCGPPIEDEKDVGFLRPDTPVLVSDNELEQLNRSRACRFRAYIEQKRITQREYLQSNFMKYSDIGRQYIHLVATPH